MCIVLALQVGEVYAKEKNWSTFPNSFYPPKRSIKPDNPAVQIPLNQDQKWKVTSKLNGKATGESGGAPAYDYTPLTGWSFIGFVPDGTSIELSKAVAAGRIHYYAMPKPQNFIVKDGLSVNKSQKKIQNQDSLVWIPGSYIIPQ
ncbi:MAG: hypothetical protein R3B45_11365 [Bdellovibrionota bacterium]